MTDQWDDAQWDASLGRLAAEDAAEEIWRERHPGLVNALALDMMMEALARPCRCRP